MTTATPSLLARSATVAGAALALGVLVAGPASAHIGTSQKEVAAGSTVALGLTVGHGCGESPTVEVAVQVPEGIVNASPFAHPGWTVTTEKEQLAEPVTSGHGDPVTERVSVITFTAQPGNELPNGVRDTFTVNFTAPDAVGERLFFKTIQTCAEGSNDWIQEYDGTGEEPESPAPFVTVTAAEGGSGHGDEGGEGEGADHESEGAEEQEPADEPEVTEVAADVTGSTSDGGDGDGTGLAIAGLVVGAAGLATGGVALARTRRTG
ncbi:MAG: YcnI family protein [Acidimicrobiia bacterium]